MQEVTEIWKYLKPEILKDWLSDNSLDIEAYKNALIQAIEHEYLRINNCEHNNANIVNKFIENPNTGKKRQMKIRICLDCGRVHYNDGGSWV